MAVPVVLYDNTAGIRNASVGWNVDTGQKIATSFTTGAVSVSLTNIMSAFVFRLGDAAGTGLNLNLYSDAAGLPGTVLTALARDPGLLPSESGPFTLSTFTPVLATVLAANTTYWVGATSSVADGYRWKNTDPTGDFSVGSGGVGDTWLPVPGNYVPTLLVNADDGTASGAPELSVNFPGFLAMGLLLGLAQRRRA